jgi:diguanylate cyclase (GGDEF)-like protein
VSTLLRRWWRRPDHYYWMTALLAARGAQTLTCRMMAASTLGFGIISAAMILSPAGPRGVRNHLIAMVVGAISVVLAAGWLRRSWPSKKWSTFYSVTLSVCIAVTCLIQSRPIAAMLGCTAFAAVGGYTAFFQTARVLTLNAVIALVTTMVLAVRIAGNGDLVLAACATALVVLANVMVPIAFHALVHPLVGGVPTSEIDELTGLLNRRAFYLRTADLLSVRGRVDDRYFVIVLVALDNFSLLTSTKGDVAGDRARVAIAQTLRENTRGDAVLGHNADAEYLIADTFSSTDASPLVERMRGAIATTPPRLTASIGVVTAPIRLLVGLPPDDVLDELIEMASTALGEARRAGGNQARYVECLSLKGPDDPGSDGDEPS